jgi:predicted nucleic acid-binding protein
LNVARGVVLDSGAFIAAERRDRTMVALIQLFASSRTPLVTSAGVVAQVWRGGGDRQVPVAYLLKRTTVVDLGRAVARTLGRMLGHSGTRDVVDAHIAFLARERQWPILTSDLADLRAIDPTLRLEKI